MYGSLTVPLIRLSFWGPIWSSMVSVNFLGLAWEASTMAAGRATHLKLQAGHSSSQSLCRLGFLYLEGL